MNRQKIVLVSYLNTLPFIYGLENDTNFELIRKPPSLCARAFIEKETDIALLPVGSLLELSDYKIITDYCIGCDGYVKTVEIMSHVPRENIKVIHLDEDSRSSALLTKILFSEYYDMPIQYIHGIPTFPNIIRDDEAVLMIGDKVFEYASSFEHKLDLGHAWKSFTGLPFAFAVWVARNNVKDDIIQNLNKKLALGIHSLDKIDWQHYAPQGIDLDEYLTKNISYILNDDKKKALNLYLDYAKKLKL